MKSLDSQETQLYVKYAAEENRTYPGRLHVIDPWPKSSLD